MSIHVQLDQFEGPLGLLLYLIKKEEMDISNIQIHKITSQYLEYIRSMRDFDLEVAGEFVAMAATLILIKSKMLLPNYNEEGEVVENEDPRKELVQRLIEYQKYQEASKKLYERPLLGRDVYVRGQREEYKEGVEEIILEDNALFQMISLYRVALLKMQRRVHRVYAKGQSIAARIMEIKDRLLPGKQVELRELLVGEFENTRTKLLITFLSVLELARLGFISIFQSDVYGDLYIDTKHNVERDVVARVQEYETQDADKVAEAWMEKAKEETMHEIPEGTDIAALELNALKHEDFPESPVMSVDQMVETMESEDRPVVAAVPEIEEMASDDDIFAAEQELGLQTVSEFQYQGTTETLAEVPVVVAPASHEAESLNPESVTEESEHDLIVTQHNISEPTEGDLSHE